MRYALPLAGIVAATIAVMPAAAQPATTDIPSVNKLINQLQPTTRGIRLPGGNGSAAEPAPQRRAAVSAPGTTAPPGTPAASMTILFATGSAELSPVSSRSLEILGRALVSPQLAAYRFRIEGHTDTVGTGEANALLSERRAAAVRDFLRAKFGINPDRIEVIGLGESQPLVRTADDVPEPRNRRVQILNLGG